MPLQAAATFGSARCVPSASPGDEGLRDVPQRGAGGDRHAVGLRVQLGQHVARVVVQPLGFGAIGVRREGDRTAHLQDHLRHGLAQHAEELVVLVEVRRALAGLRVAHVHVQHRRAGVVAVDRRLHLLLPAEGKVLHVARQPLGAEGRRGDDRRLHVFGEERVIGEVHGRCSCVDGGMSSSRRRQVVAAAPPACRSSSGQSS